MSVCNDIKYNTHSSVVAASCVPALTEIFPLFQGSFRCLQFSDLALVFTT